MTDQLTPLAVQNAELLRAIGSGPFGSLSELAGAADLAVNNLNRKLDSLIGEGLIVRDGEASHEVTITERGHRALNAIAAFGGAARPSELSPHLIDPNPWQPRQVIEEGADAELAQSVADKGILQPVLVRPHPTEPGRWQQALGHRRVRAARGVGIAVPVIVRELTDDDMADIGVVENVQRADLHWMDEAEGYRMLADRGRSAAEIVRLVGEGGRKKRSIQELIQFARELDDETKARCRLPDTPENRERRLTVDQVRFMVGNKRPKPALDLTPKLAATLLELVHAGEAFPNLGRLETSLFRRPVGGPMITLADRGLIKLVVIGGEPAASIPLTEELTRYLDQVGFDDDPPGAVFKAIAAVIGELATGALLAGGRHLTHELNPAEGAVAMADAATADAPDEDADYDDGARFGFGSPDAAQTARPAPTLSPSTAATLVELAHRIERAEFHRFDREWSAWCDGFRGVPSAVALSEQRLCLITPAGLGYAVQLDLPGKRWLEAEGFELDDKGRFHVTDDRLGAYQEAAEVLPIEGLYSVRWFLAEPRPAGGALAPKPKPKVDARAGLILLEMAHKIARDARPGDPNPSAAVDPSYRHDAMSNQMVFDRLAMFIIQGARTATALTQPAIEWLEAQGLERDDAGLFLINDEALLFRQVEAGEAPQGLYVTPWLQAAVAAEALAQAGQPPRDAFAEQIREAIRDDGEAGYNRPSTAPVPILRATLSRLMAAAREARRVIQSAETHRLKPEDTAPVVALLDAAMGDAQRDLDRT